METGYDDFCVPSVVRRIEIDLTPPALREDSESINYCNCNGNNSALSRGVTSSALVREREINSGQI